MSALSTSKADLDSQIASKPPSLVPAQCSIFLSPPWKGWGALPMWPLYPRDRKCMGERSWTAQSGRHGFKEIWGFLTPETSAGVTDGD